MKLLENEKYRKDLLMAAQVLPEKSFSILVTGATGLIGSFLVDTLRYANIEMNRQYKIFAMGRSMAKMQERFGSMKEEPLFFLEQDVCQPFPETMDVDYIINAASNADPRSYDAYPAETILTNVLGTKNMLEYARVHNCRKVLLTSTMEVYGRGILNETFEENDFGKIDFNLVRAGYPESKRTSELLCRSYVKEYGVPAVIARLGYIYGPTMQGTDHKVVAQFIRSILAGEDLVLKSYGKQQRSYLYVADTVTGILAILLHGRNGEAYNVASSESIVSIRDMAGLLAKLGNGKVRFEIADEEKGILPSQQNNVLNEEKLKKLGWMAKYKISEGLKQTIEIMSQSDWNTDVM